MTDSQIIGTGKGISQESSPFQADKKNKDVEKNSNLEPASKLSVFKPEGAYGLIKNTQNLMQYLLMMLHFGHADQKAL